MKEGLHMIHGIVNNALMATHTAFCAKVLSVSGNTARVQPLNMVKAIGGDAKKQAVLDNVPILKPTYIPTVRCGGDDCNVSAGITLNIKAGDTVYCLCAERDITETRKGKFAVPVAGRHMMSSAVIIGKF